MTVVWSWPASFRKLRRSSLYEMPVGRLSKKVRAEFQRNRCEVFPADETGVAPFESVGSGVTIPATSLVCTAASIAARSASTVPAVPPIEVLPPGFSRVVQPVGGVGLKSNVIGPTPELGTERGMIWAEAVIPKKASVIPSASASGPMLRKWPNGAVKSDLVFMISQLWLVRLQSNHKHQQRA